ncbi:unnamed protein product [Cylicocyclus nassatus]|uniref:WAP domain-containing protein n=1 Tax=Cylicocyclus nassatus TaxID=53992 RepID=A0AA36GI01_CYLNA|nr:unnamed protein product [Cylicocyclus nassatus]
MKFLLLIIVTLPTSNAQHRLGNRPSYGGYGYPGQLPYGYQPQYGYPYRYPYYGYRAPGANYRPGPYTPFTPQPLQPTTTQPTQPTQQCAGPCVNGLCPEGYACNAGNTCCRVGM